MIFDEPDDGLFDGPGLDLHGPPWALAGMCVVAGIASVVVGWIVSGTAGWIGYGLGFGAFLLGIAYRWHLRTAQMSPRFLTDLRVDRTMLAGVAIGFVGIVVSALAIAERVIE